MAEYCGTPQSKERRNREYKACPNERAIVRLLDARMDCNFDKSIKNFPISSAWEKGLQTMLIAL
jgi:hypothetical protein